MLPQVVSLTNTPNGSHSGGEDACDSSSSSSHSRLLHQSITCLPSSSNSSWFHGTLSRTEADHILMDSTPGSFLVRQQDSSRFYIDIATAKGVEHHPVKRLGRQYFYSGKCYSSLSDLVSLFNEQGGEPITTSQYKSSSSQSLEEDDLTRCIAQSAYHGDPINNELSNYIGDVITLLEKPDADWVLARNNRTNETGYVPSYILGHLIDGIEDLTQIAYTHGPEVTDVLHQMRICRGSFLIRPSSRGTDSWAILVNVGNDQVKKFLIKQARDDQGGWILSGRRFPSVQHIIDRYCYYPILNDVRLCHAVLADRNRPESRSLSASSDASPEEEVKVFPTTSCEAQNIVSIVALRKSRDDKPWKTCHLTLRNDPHGSCQLIMANDAEHQKVRNVYKLPFCILYNLEESVFDQEGCFYLSPTDIHGPGTYICIQPFFKFAEWISHLRPRVQALRIGDLPLFDGFRFELPEAPAIALWKIHLDKFESDTLKADNLYSANVNVNGVKVCSSAMLTPSTNRTVPAIIFDSSFVIPFAPCINSSVQVNIVSHQKGKNVRPFTVSPLMQMPLSDTTKYTLSNGICLRMSCSRISVLPEPDYLSIQDWIEFVWYLSCKTAKFRAYPIAFLEYVSDNLSNQDRSLFSQCIVCHLFSQPKKLLDLVEAVLTPTLASSAAESALRQDSLATSLMSQLLRVAIRSELEKVIDARGLSTSKMADAHDIEFIVLNIISLCQTRIVSQMLRLVKAVTERRFPNDAQAVRRVLCTVLILRFTNPVILTKFNSLPVGQAVAKGVQASANATCAKFLDRDEYQHTAALRRFFDELGSVQSLPRESASQRPAHFDWLAIACHLIHSTISSRPKETLPHVPDHVLRVIFAHHAQN